MKTFEDYQVLATKLPISLRNDRDRIEMPVMGLQHEAGKVGSLLDAAFSTGTLSLTPKQTGQVKDSLADILWCVALLCKETGLSMQDLANHSLEHLQQRAKDFDPDSR